MLPRNKLQALVLVLLGLAAILTIPAVAAGTDPADVIPVGQSQPVRAWHFVLQKVPLTEARRLVDRAAGAGFNTVVVQLSTGVSLPDAPWKPARDAWNADEFRGWVAHARSRGMTVVPEVKLLTKQNKFFQQRQPQLMYNKSTYDPRNPDVFRKVFRFLDALIALIDPQAIHIGHDEVAGFSPHSRKKFLRPGEKVLPGKLFLESVRRVHGHLASRGIETWMWGDMLVAPGEVPAMRAKSLHGGKNGYGKAVRTGVPKDIVICDWHYRDEQTVFPTIDLFRKEGYRVLGSTWKREQTTVDFSRYASQHGAGGMIATTWFHVGRQEWDVVHPILDGSGAVFLKDFPDVR